MIALRWAAASTLALALLPGCTTPPKPEPAPPAGPTTASPDRVAALRATYLAVPGTLAGVVEAASDKYVAVSGIEPSAVTKQDVLTFIDVETNQVINHGTLHEVTAAGRLVVEFDTQGESRAPRIGDLCVRLK
jgi:hypothetical protein